MASDALVAWCAGLIDQGYRGEMECIVAKIFGSEAQKEAAIELMMKTHGGRAFLHGHMFGDNVHEFLAPCIYEGEGEMLGMAFFKSLVKQHGTQFFEPIGKTLAAAGIRKPNMMNPAHAWALREPLWQYSKWYLARNCAAARPAVARHAAGPAQPCGVCRSIGCGHSAPGDQRLDAEVSTGLGRSAVRAWPRFRCACRMRSSCSARACMPRGRATNWCATRPTAFATTCARKLTGQRPSDRYLRSRQPLGRGHCRWRLRGHRRRRCRRDHDALRERLSA